MFIGSFYDFHSKRTVMEMKWYVTYHADCKWLTACKLRKRKKIFERMKTIALIRPQKHVFVRYNETTFLFICSMLFQMRFSICVCVSVGGERDGRKRENSDCIYAPIAYTGLSRLIGCTFVCAYVSTCYKKPHFKCHSKMCYMHTQFLWSQMGASR